MKCGHFARPWFAMASSGWPTDAVKTSVVTSEFNRMAIRLVMVSTDRDRVRQIAMQRLFWLMST